MPKIVYLTGAPASGKSSTTMLLSGLLPDLKIWEYGARLTEYVRRRDAEISSQEEIREKSSAIITPEDVARVDDLLLKFVAEHRGRDNVVIDSHAVTKEEYGFRITPFSFLRFAELSPDEIWVLSASPETTRKRIGDDAGGRPLITEEEARTHTALQSSVAATYAMSLGIPCHIFDTDRDREELVNRLAGRLS